MKYLESKGKYFAIRLIQAREDFNVSRTELTNALTEAGFKKTYDDILKYEKSIRKSNVDVVEKMTGILGVTTEWILDDDETTYFDPSIKYLKDSSNLKAKEGINKLDSYNKEHIKAIDDYIIKNVKKMSLHVKEKIYILTHNELDGKKENNWSWLKIHFYFMYKVSK